MLNDYKKKYGNGLNRRDFFKYSSVGLGSIYFTGCKHSNSEKIANYPIESSVYTTLEETVKLSDTILPVIIPKNLQDISKYDVSGYGVWENGGPLLAVLRRDIMPSAYTLPAENRPKKLLRFFAITDIHITDKESPSQLIYLQSANVAGDYLGIDLESKITSVYSPTMLYTTHVLDAAIQTVNALHKQDSIDFGISLGDTCNSTQYNETRWYIDVLDGKVITPSSGVNAGSELIDYQKPFKAAGLDAEIPWYQAIGNHDHFWMGSIPLDKGNLRESYISNEVIAMANSLARASDIYNMNPPLYYMGVIDGTTPTGNIIKAGPVVDFTSAPTVIPDVRRRSLTKVQWAEEFFDTSTNPAGHGLNLVPEGKAPEFACYSFFPNSELPLKVIVLDNTQSEEDGDNSIHGRGFLDVARWTWLKKELKDCTDNGQLMIIACHVPIGVSPHKADNNGKDTYMDWYENTRSADMANAVDLLGLLDELHSHPNLLMWMAGHRHVNTVKAFVHSNVEQSFWHVETSSLHDFPQQLRLFEINLNSDYTISIDVTNVDPAVKKGTPAWTARKYAVATQQIVKTDLSPNFIGAVPTTTGYSTVKDPTIEPIDEKIGSYNAKLLIQLSSEMIEKMKSIFPIV